MAGGAYMVGGMCVGAMCGRGHACEGGGYAWQGAMCGRGMCMARETATAADGTQPTGMHSCYY